MPHPPLRRLLIANRGEIALRIMRTAHALGIATVAVYSDPDAAAPHVRAADEAVRLPGAAPADTYLRGDRIVAAARATGADAIHPGYGFLSENAAFAAAVTAAGLTFVGPGPDAIAAMGSKLRAKELMAKADVPVLPGGEIPAAAPASVLAEVASRAGFPLLIKASAGGGGRGMRLVTGEAELAGAVEAASREAAAAFGDGTVFAERFVTDPRHIEVQIVGDTHGNAVHLFERECSIQRRYQKIIEEAPSPAVDDSLRAELGEAAVRAARAIGYVGAGTVEFVLDQSGRFYFLEVNTRLQVEHPVTELVTGLDLVEVQLRVAAGEPLPPEVSGARLTGHAIEARLYAEDVAAGFTPATGTLHRFEIQAGPGVRVDAGYESGNVVSPHYDAMLAKVIGYGGSRDEAARRLERALRHARVHGVTTNLGLLAAILAEPEFLAGRTDTGYLTRHDPSVLAAPPGERVAAVHALAAALARQAANRAAAPVLSTLPSGWRNVPSARHHAEYVAQGSGANLTVAYRVDGPDVLATVNGAAPGTAIVIRDCTPELADLEIDGIRRRYQVQRVRDDSGAVLVYVSGPGTCVTLTEVTRLADPSAAAASGSLLAPMPAMVIAVTTAAGDRVTAGQPLVVLEAMKMQHSVLAPGDGVIAELRVKEGDQVATGQVLAVMAETEQPDAPADLRALTADLGAETAVLRQILDSLSDADWKLPTPAPGWTITDQVSHLAYFDQVAVTSATDPAEFAAEVSRLTTTGGVDPDAIARRYHELPAAELLDWFGRARGELITVFAELDPAARVPWFGPAMSVASSLTARIMETWAHGQDIADTVGQQREPTDRLRHVAHIGVGARPFSYAANRRPVPAEPVRVELIAPSGATWAWGPADASDRVTGPALDFCLLVTQRRHRADTAVQATGAAADEWLSIAQSFAGPPGAGRVPGQFAGQHG